MTELRELQIGVVGAGTMGAGIAEVALTSGYNVILCDVQSEALDKARATIERHLQRSVEKGRLSADSATQYLKRLQLSTELTALQDVPLVIEAVPENINLKRRILKELEGICSSEALLATNTSSISITVLSAGLTRANRVVGLHFFNPAPIMKLIEVVAGEDTDASVIQRATQFAQSFNKVTVLCQDTPGFIVNRVARNYYGESLRIVGEGGADFATVDWLLEEVAGFRMGPFRLMDLIGIDVNFDVTKSVYEAYHQESRFRPHLLQEKKVLSGHLGRKTNRGFYTYDQNGAAHPARLDIMSRQNINTTNQQDAVNLEYDADAQGTVNSRGTVNSQGTLSSQGTVSSQDAVWPIVIGDTPLAHALAHRIQEGTGEDNRALLFDGPPRPAYREDVSERLHQVRQFLAQHRDVDLSHDSDVELVQHRVTELARYRHTDVVIVAVAGDASFHKQLLQVVEDSVTADTLILTSLAGPSATKQASWLRNKERVRGFSGLLRKDDEKRSENGDEFHLGPAAEWSRPAQVGLNKAADKAGTVSNLAGGLRTEDRPLYDLDLQTVRVLRTLKLEPIEVPDGPGGVVLRILSMIQNEALQVIYEGTASAHDIDLGMRLGTNYPAGPVEWLNAIGTATAWYTLHSLHEDLGDGRYRVLPGLQNRFWASL